MQNNYARTVRGLSIATTILSACGVALWAVCAVALIVGGVVLTSPDTIAWMGEHSTSGYTIYEQHGAEAATGILGAAMGASVIAFLVPAALAGVSLAAGIMGMKHHSTPERYGSLFAWTIAGAITSFFSGGYIATVLLIITAVYVSKLRTDPNVAQQIYGQPFTQPGSGVSFDQANQAYNPAYGPTGQGYGAPFVQPTAQPGAAPQQPPMAGAPAQQGWTQGAQRPYDEQAQGAWQQPPQAGAWSQQPQQPQAPAWQQGQAPQQPQGYPQAAAPQQAAPAQQQAAAQPGYSQQPTTSQGGYAQPAGDNVAPAEAQTPAEPAQAQTATPVVAAEAAPEPPQAAASTTVAQSAQEPVSAAASDAAPTPEPDAQLEQNSAAPAETPQDGNDQQNGASVKQ